MLASCWSVVFFLPFLYAGLLHAEFQQETHAVQAAQHGNGSTAKEAFRAVLATLREKSRTQQRNLDKRVAEGYRKMANLMEMAPADRVDFLKKEAEMWQKAWKKRIEALRAESRKRVEQWKKGRDGQQQEKKAAKEGEQNQQKAKDNKLLNECATTDQNDCSPSAICTDTEDSYTCACPPNHLDLSPDPVKRPGRRCLLPINECVEGIHDCSPNANCNDTDEGYNCTCADDFVDESADKERRPGRVCRPALVDECRLRKHDCHPEAQCVDLDQGFTCQCRAQFLDESTNRVTHPGRICVPRPTSPPEECRLGEGEGGCKPERNEVCRVVAGVPKCACPINYERDPVSGACTVINECQLPHLNDCHPSAECKDLAQGFSCECRAGFRDVSPSKDKPGRSCQAMVNECQFAHLNDCHQSAQCVDMEDGYQCRCNQGFKDLRPERSGRLCQQMVNECARTETNSCDKNAKCIDEEDGYRCECRSGFADVSPTPSVPGRVCHAVVNECAESKLNDCDRSARCVDMEDGYRCECPPNSRDISPSPAFPGRVCNVFEDECASGKHDCDPQALCRDNEQAFSCECPEGYTDSSPNRTSKPGRVCVKLVDECKEARHTCSVNAECRDLEEGYTCECRDGYVDRSPNLATQPGRVCGPPETCPANNDCSAAAVCVPHGDNKYSCSCIQGYIDQSPEGLHGRICVRNSFCRDPKLNNCSRNAVCYEEGQGYRCECARGYVDKSVEGMPGGRICEMPPSQNHERLEDQKTFEEIGRRLRLLDEQHQMLLQMAEHNRRRNEELEGQFFQGFNELWKHLYSSIHGIHSRIDTFNSALYGLRLRDSLQNKREAKVAGQPTSGGEAEGQ